MEYNPPVQERTTEQLMEIIEAPEKWKVEVVELAELELTNRGISLDKQKASRKRKKNYLRRTIFIKANATYSTTEKILIVLFGPILAIALGDLFMFHAGEGYKKKNLQGFLYFLLGILLWGLILYVYFKEF